MPAVHAQITSTYFRFRCTQLSSGATRSSCRQDTLESQAAVGETTPLRPLLGYSSGNMSGLFVYQQCCDIQTDQLFFKQTPL